jgi:hypothetical protein
LEELDVLDADPGTLRGIASEMERLAAPAPPSREYPSLNLWRRLERRPAAVPYCSEPLRIAAMYEAAASDADREAQYWLGRLHESGATASIESSIRAADDAMRRAAEVLAKAELEVRHAA